MSSDVVRVGAWRLLVRAGTGIDDLERLTGRPAGEIECAVTGRLFSDLPGPVLGGPPVDGRLHRARLLLRALLDASDRSGGPDACWPTTGWTQHGRPARHTSLLRTSSASRAVLMVTSNVLSPPPGLVAAHSCHRGHLGCVAPRHLNFVPRAVNSGHHRRLRRLGIEVPPRTDDELQNLDVLEPSCSLQDLELLAKLEAELARAVASPNGRGCMVIAGAEANTHYGLVRVGGRQYPRHRFFLTLVGAPLTEGLIVEHLCGVKPCFSLGVGHIQPGTYQSNTRHAIATGLTPVAEKHANAYYTNVEAREIREQAGLGVAEIHRRYGGSVRSVRNVLDGRTYASVGGPRRTEPFKRRLSDLGVYTVRVLRACGASESGLAGLYGLGVPYLRQVTAGELRARARGPLTAAPGSATGRRVATAKLTAVDRRVIAERFDAGVSCRAIAAELELSPSTVGKRLHPRRAAGR